MQVIFTYIPETHYVPREYSVAAILLLLFIVLISLVPVLNLLSFYIFTFRSVCVRSDQYGCFLHFLIIIITIIIIIIIIIISFMQVIFTYIPETNYVPREYSVQLFCCYYSLFLYIFSFESIVLLHYHFPKCVCCDQYGCFLQFLIIIITIIIIIIIIIISFMHVIFTYIPEKNYVPREYSVAAILLLLFTVLLSLVSVVNLLYFYISTFRSVCAVPNMAVFCSSLSLLLLLLLLSSSSSPLCRLFLLTFLRQITSLGNTALQLFCC